MPVLDLRLDYGVSPTSGRSLLSSVTLCTGDGDCLAPTRFGFGQPAFTPAFASLGTWTGPVLERLAGGAELLAPPSSGAPGDPASRLSLADLGIRTVDVDGDGLDDLLAPGQPDPEGGPTGTILFRNSGHGFSAQPALPGRHPRERVMATGDFDGDGSMDLVVARSGDTATDDAPSHGAFAWSRCDARFRTGQGFVCRPIPNVLAGTLRHWVYDFDADDRSDVLFDSKTAQRLCLSTATSFECRDLPAGQRYVLPPASLLKDPNRWSNDFSDIDGDGRTDLMNYESESGALVAYSYGYDAEGPRASDRVRLAHWPDVAPESAGAAGDLNGDGYTDFVAETRDARSGMPTYRICYGSGLRSAAACEALPLALGSRVLLAGDFIRNGQRATLVADDADPLHLRSCVVHGDARAACPLRWEFRDAEGYRLTRTSPGDRWLFLQLIDGTVPELVRYRRGGHYEVFGARRLAAPREALDQLVWVEDGWGVRTEWRYAPGNFVYDAVALDPDDRPLSTSWPIKSVPRIADIVAGARQSVRGQHEDVAYKYAGAARSSIGRGYLGFRRIDRIVDREPSRTDWYANSWPFIGLSTDSVIRWPDGGTVLHTDWDAKHRRLDAHRTTVIAVSRRLTSKKTTSNAETGHSDERNLHDDWGNLVASEKTDTEPGGRATRTTVRIDYAFDPARDAAPRKKSASTTVTRGSGVPQVTRDWHDFDPVTLETKSQGHSDSAETSFHVQTIFKDVRGLLRRIEKTWFDRATDKPQNTIVREFTEYDNHERMFQTVLDGSQQVVHRELSDARDGRWMYRADANGEQLRRGDLFGLEWIITGPDAQETHHYVRRCDASCPVGASVEIDVRLRRGPDGAKERIGDPNFVFRDGTGAVAGRWPPAQNAASASTSK